MTHPCQELSEPETHLGEAGLLADRLEDALAAPKRGLTLASERGHRGTSLGPPPPR